MHRSFLVTSALMVLLTSPAGHAASDDRQLVELPAPMQAHMMSNMRDHLLALNEILALLAEGKVSEAGDVAENRIGMSSLETHGAAHLAPFMPEAMQTFGAEMHKASSRFALVAQEAEIEGTYEAQQKVFGALADVTQYCNDCYAAYRIR